MDRSFYKKCVCSGLALPYMALLISAVYFSCHVVGKKRACKVTQSDDSIVFWFSTGWGGGGFLPCYADQARDNILKLLRSPGIDSQPGGPVRQPYLAYRSARLHRPAGSIPLEVIPGFLEVKKYRLWPNQRTTTLFLFGS
jgi:hypothetical protein